MKLKQGHCVATADINEDNLQQVLSVFRASGCRVNGAFSIHNIKYFRFLEWHTDHLVKTDGVANFEMLLTAEQIIGADEKPNFDFSRTPDSGKSEWHERGEKPPVHENIEWCGKRGGYWVKARVVDYTDEQICLLHHSDQSYKPHKMEVFNFSDIDLRPIKTERERAIEEMLPILASLDGTQAKAEIACGKLYDAGFRKEGK